MSAGRGSFQGTFGATSRLEYVTLSRSAFDSLVNVSLGITCFYQKIKLIIILNNLLRLNYKEI